MKKHIDMENPLVSIITPTFNSEKSITEVIKSIQNQTYTNWEMIIVDDCSSDKTVSIISNFAQFDARIKLFHLEKNSGAGVARNKALSKATGRFISFLDSDDLWKPMKTEKQIDFLLKNKLPFTFSFYECINEEGILLNKRVEAPMNLSYRQLFFCNYVGNLTGIYDANYIGKLTISSSRKRQDWILWLSILKKVKTAQPIPESLAFYRVRENSISASKLDLLKHNFAVYRTFHGFNLVVSLACMIGFLFTQLIIKPQYIKRSN
jgi:glycosyltransferase involved in cell wall biosynthesis